MKKFTLVTLVLIFSVVALADRGEATFYGQIPKGYQWVEKGGWGYGLYIPKSFDPVREPVLIFSFGRNENDGELSIREIEEYVKVWAEEAEKRGYVVVVPYWQPVVVDDHYRAERYFLEVLEEVIAMCDLNPQKVLLVGFGLGGVWAYSLAVLYPDRFGAVVTIASSPLRDRVMSGLLSQRQWKKFKGHILLIHGENDGVIPIAWVEEDKSWLAQDGAHVEFQPIQDMTHEHTPKVNSIILDWFDGLKDT